MHGALVTKLPLNALHTERGVADKLRDLSKHEVEELLRLGQVRFVVADVGLPFRWYDERQCFEVWKSEVKQHIADGGHASLDDFKSGFFYFASEWADGGTPIVLLSKNH